MDLFGTLWNDTAMMVVVGATLAASLACIAAAMWNLVPCDRGSRSRTRVPASMDVDLLLRPAPPVGQLPKSM